MCYKWKSDIKARDPLEPTIERWRYFIDSLRSLMKDKSQINFAGGEPLARAETLELINYAHKHGFVTLLATNAFLIDETMAENIAASGVTTVNISLDSLREDRHDSLRGVRGAYQKVMRAIELLDKYSSDVKIGICTVISNENLDELVDIVRWIQENDKIDGMGFQAITQPFSTPEDLHWYTDSRYSSLWPIDLKKVDKIMNGLIKMKESGFNKLGNSLPQLQVFKAYFHNPNDFVKQKKCHIDTQAINITPTGEIRICFYMEPIGNIKYDDINTVWNSSKAEMIREKIAQCKRNCQSMVNCNFDPSEVYIY